MWTKTRIDRFKETLERSGTNQMVTFDGKLYDREFAEFLLNQLESLM